jgi:hypothetical protein
MIMDQFRNVAGSFGRRSGVRYGESRLVSLPNPARTSHTDRRQARRNSVRRLGRLSVVTAPTSQPTPSVLGIHRMRR